MPTSEDDVLDLLNRAAIDPPEMHLPPRSVLNSAQARRGRRRRTHGGLALAAVTVAATVWLGLGSEIGDLLGDDIEPAKPTERNVEALTPVEWDDSISFDSPLPADGPGFEGFRGGSLVREPGGDFTVTLPDGAPPLTPISGDLPPGVDWFTAGGSILIVSEPLFEGEPVLSFDPYAEGDSTGVPLTGGEGEPFMWFLNDPVSPKDVNDIYWLLPDQVVASSGTPIINDVVEVDGDQVPLMIAPEEGLWAQRSLSGLAMAVEPGDINGMASDGDLYVTVLPADAGPATWVGPGGTTVPIQTRAVGNVKLAWATPEEAPDADGLSMFQVDESDANGLEAGPPATLVASTSGEATRVWIEGTETVITLGSDGPSPASGSIGSDGSALVAAPLPEGIAKIEGPWAADTATPEAVFRYEDGPISILIGGAEISKEAEIGAPGSLLLPGKIGMVAVGLPPQEGMDPEFVEVLPTLLFRGSEGPQWAGQGRPVTIEVGQSQIHVAVEPNLGIWAGNCEASEMVLGTVESKLGDAILCTDPEDATSNFVFATMVAPSDVAATAQLIPRAGTRSEFEALGEPTVADLGDGLSFWAMPLGHVDGDKPAFEVFIDSIVGVDLDGDGTADQ